MEKMQVNGLEQQKYARKKSLAVSVACMAIYGPAPGLKKKTRIFYLWVLYRWALISASASTPLPGNQSMAQQKREQITALNTRHTHNKGDD